MINCGVREVFVEPFVSGPLIGAKQADFVGDGFSNEGVKGSGLDVRDHARHNVSLAADCADDWRFAGTNAASSSAAAALIPMPVFGQAADESFIDFDNTDNMHSCQRRTFTASSKAENQVLTTANPNKISSSKNKRHLKGLGELQPSCKALGLDQGRSARTKQRRFNCVAFIGFKRPLTACAIQSGSPPRRCRASNSHTSHAARIFRFTCKLTLRVFRKRFEKPTRTIGNRMLALPGKDAKKAEADKSTISKALSSSNLFR